MNINESAFSVRKILLAGRKRQDDGQSARYTLRWATSNNQCILLYKKYKNTYFTYV